MSIKKSTKTELNESWELSARDVLIPLLRPGESLCIALSGPTGWLEGVSLLDLLKALLDVLGGIPTSELNRTTYIGITDEDLVFAITKDPKQPSSLQRVPLGYVSIVKFKESRTPFLIDVLVIDAGTKRLTLSTWESQRPIIRELAEILTRHRQEAALTGSDQPRQDTPAQQAAPIPLHVRLSRPLMSALQDLSATLRAEGPARASIRASRYSFGLGAAAVAADVVFIVGLVALGSILPTGLSGPLRDFLLFILILPMLLLILLSFAAALVAAGLAISSIFKRGEKPLTVIAALLAAAALLICYAIFGALLLGGE